MWLYILLYIIVTVAYMQTIDHDRYSPKLLAYLLLMLALFVGCSDMLGGYDRYIYCDLFDGTANTIRNGGNPFNGALFTLYYNEKGGAYSTSSSAMSPPTATSLSSSSRC